MKNQKHGKTVKNGQKIQKSWKNLKYIFLIFFFIYFFFGRQKIALLLAFQY